MARSTLIVLAILFTLVAFVAADVDFWRTHGLHGRVHYHSNTLLTSFAIASRGEIEIDEERGAIIAMEPGAYLEIRERRLTTRRRLEVRGDDAGRPTYRYEIGSDERPRAEAEEYLSANLDEILSTTTIGAEARARRLAREQGAEHILRELDRLETNTLRRIYLIEAARAPGLDADTAARVVRTAGRAISSSSQLRESLEEISETLPLEWTVTGELARAAESIHSSSARASALEAIVRLRALEGDDVEALRDSVASMPSSSEKGRLIRRLVELEPSPAFVGAMLAATRTIDSSAERRRTLDALVSVEGLQADLYREALDVAEEIPSSAEKAAFLVGLAKSLPADPQTEVRFVEVASTIASSVEQGRALTALLEGRALSASVCVEWIRSASEIASSKVTGDLLVAGSGRCGAAEEVRRAFLTAVEELPSSVDQRRALTALIAASDLDATAREEIADVAERAIASSSERELVLRSLGVGRP